MNRFCFCSAGYAVCSCGVSANHHGSTAAQQQPAKRSPPPSARAAQPSLCSKEACGYFVFLRLRELRCICDKMVYTLPADLQEKARVELNETDETKAAALTSLRAKLDAASLPIAAAAESSWKPARTDDDFLLRFLRQKKFRVDDAFNAMKAHAEFFREHGARFQGGSAAECHEMYDMMGTMIVPQRDAEGRLCTLLVPSRMNLNPGLSPAEYTSKALRSMWFLMEAVLDDPYVQVNGMVVFENFAGFSISSAGKMKSLIPDELQKLQMGCLKVTSSPPLAPKSPELQKPKPLWLLGVACSTYWHFYFESAMVCHAHVICPPTSHYNNTPLHQICKSSSAAARQVHDLHACHRQALPLGQAQEAHSRLGR
jgi:hypothetical protein